MRKPGALVAAEDPAGRFEPVQLSHADVHEHDVRVMPLGVDCRLDPAHGLGDHVDFGLLGKKSATC
jgi:hypothetical protein